MGSGKDRHHVAECTCGRMGTLDVDMGREVGLFRFEGKVPDREYSNYVTILFSPSEFVLDFGRTVPGGNRPAYRTGVMLSPIAVKELASVLNSEIKAYEEKYGEIMDVSKLKDGEGTGKKLVGFRFEEEEPLKED